MVSEVLAGKLIEFVAKHRIQSMKYNERTWGSYEPVVSFDGVNWLNLGQLFGWGFSLEEAVAISFDRSIDEDILQQWLGTDRYAELRKIIYEERERLDGSVGEVIDGETNARNSNSV